MDAQRSPEECIADNGRICLDLLGWEPGIAGWIKPDGFMFGGCGTPSFTTWAEAGLILEALEMKREPIDVLHEDEDWSAEFGVYRSSARATTGPLAIRAAALEYIKAVKS